MTTHNPDNLTEWGQSKGWRLLTVEERSKRLPEDAQFYENGMWLPSDSGGRKPKNEWRTYRTREPLPSQPDDDLSYYEKELPAVIAGVRRGEKWEYQDEECEWVKATDQSENELAYRLKENFRVRLAPVPVVKPWDCPADVPGPVCWLRPEPGAVESLVGAIKHSGVYVFGINQCGWRDWDKLEGAQYSTDRITWKSCVKPEGGK